MQPLSRSGLHFALHLSLNSVLFDVFIQNRRYPLCCEARSFRTQRLFCALSTSEPLVFSIQTLFHAPAEALKARDARKLTLIFDGWEASAAAQQGFALPRDTTLWLVIGRASLPASRV